MCCGALYACDAPGQTGCYSAVCETCRGIELGSQLSIERRPGKAVRANAFARRNKINTDAGLLVAFGMIDAHTPARLNAQGGGSHGE